MKLTVRRGFEPGRHDATMSDCPRSQAFWSVGAPTRAPDERVRSLLSEDEQSKAGRVGTSAFLTVAYASFPNSATERCSRPSPSRPTTTGSACGSDRRSAWSRPMPSPSSSARFSANTCPNGSSNGAPRHCFSCSA
ncbi:hypothetical protein RHCRD62_70240 [Rhodococcus sp. RD6.2]|nr:hypothetical protein RHCRD62_70240 [Rhodococcus sp. RD6.2]